MTKPSAPDKFNRPPRIQMPPVNGEIEIPSPADDPDETNRSMLLSLLPFTSILVMGGFYLYIGSQTGRSAVFALPMLAMGLVSVLTSLLTYSTQKHEQFERQLKQRRDYHRLLNRRQARLQAGQDLQLYYNQVKYPDPATLHNLVTTEDPAVWNRRATDHDFSAVRLGIGKMPSSVTVKLPDPDQQAEELPRALKMGFKYREIPNTSVTINLQNIGALGIHGTREDVQTFLYSLVAQLSVFHAPTDLNVYLFSSPAAYRAWLWLRWLPHTSNRHEGGFPSYIAYEPQDARAMLDRLARRLEDRIVPEDEDEADSEMRDQSLIVAIVEDPSSIEGEVAYETLLRLSGPARRVVTICVADTIYDIPSSCNSIITVEANTITAEFVGPESIRLEARPDRVTRADVERLARDLVHLQMPQVGDAQRIPTTVDLLQTYRAQTLEDLTGLIASDTRGWQRTVRKGRLPFPTYIGNTSFSTPLEFDLSEQQHGPHGLVAGTTGSGKSELLQTLVCALAIEHHPYLINFLLIDYKGGSTFAVFEPLPHTVGIITNLNTDEALRALEAIDSENRRRQEFLARYNVADINEYHRLLDAHGGQIHEDWDPLPHLCIIIDEFAELKSELPDFLDELVATVRVGRSLGMHLILATQRPMGHVTDEMRANLQFRICLRVQNPEESREMLRRPDAAYLPHNVPGRAYFQVGTMIEQFQSAYVGMDYEGPTAESEQYSPLVVEAVHFERTRSVVADLNQDSGIFPVLDSALSTEETRQHAATESAGGPAPAVNETTDTPRRATRSKPKFVEALVNTMSTLYENMSADQPFLQMPKEVLLPSLAKEIPLQDILHPVTHQLKAHSYDFGGWDEKRRDWSYAPPPDRDHRRWLCAPIGLIDNLATREQPPLLANLYGADKLHGPSGNVLIVGSSGSGKTTALRTVAMSIAHLYRPDEVQMYILSFAGHELGVLRDLPHVGAVITGDQRERVLRLFRFLLNSVEQRRIDFSRLNVDNIEQYRDKLMETGGRRTGTDDLSLHPAIIVMIDNILELQKAFPDDMNDVLQLMRNGRGTGIHFVATSSAANLSPQMMNLLEQRIALNQVEKSDYFAIVGRMDGRQPSSTPGTGVLRQSPPLHVQIALPGRGVTDQERNNDMQATIKAMDHAWGSKERPAEIKILPSSVNLDGAEGLLYLTQRRVAMTPTPDMTFERLITPIGRESLTLNTRYLDWLQEGPHFVITGPVASGKSSLLRTLVLSAADRYSPDELWIVLVDFSQRSLRALAQLPHVIHYVTNEEDLFEQLAHLQKELDRRRKRIEQRQQIDGNHQFAVPDHYAFPPIMLIFDDYDQVHDAMADEYPNVLNNLGMGIRRNTDLGYHIALAGELSSISVIANRDRLLKQISLMRCGFSLMTADGVDLLGGRPTGAMRREEHPEGRGYWILRGQPSLMQFAQSIDLATLIKSIQERWIECPPAIWPYPVSPNEMEDLKSAIKGLGSYQSPASTSASSDDLFDNFSGPDLIKEYQEHKKQFK